jgi:hypothetical protein
MSDTENDIVQLSKDFLAAQVSELYGNEDPKAFQMLRSGDDVLGMSLVDIPQGEDQKDLMADYLAASCCVHRAVEATFASAAWSSMYSNPLEAGWKLPGQRGNRVEIVMLVHVTSEAVRTHTAAILRVGGTVRLSPWLNEPGLDVSNTGRIPEALRMGIKLSHEMPEELIQALDRAKGEVPLGRIVEMIVNQIRQVRDDVRSAAEKN